MDQALLAPLNQVESSLNTLLTSLTNTNTYTAAPSATQSLLDADDALSSALVQLKQHQDNYARILTLRAESVRLQGQLRDIVRTCVDLRSEIGQIHPSILEDTDDEEEEQEPIAKSGSILTSRKENKPVDYETLLSFAARIGKHNAAAAIEAERQSNMRQGNASKPKPQESNGTNTQSTQVTDSGAGMYQADTNNTTQESLAELAAINDTLAQQRAYRGMAFPGAEELRMGELGRLQYMREQEGEEAVERYIEQMIRDSEKVAGKAEPPKKEEEEDVSTSTKPEPVSSRPEIPMYTVPQQQRPAAPPAGLPPKPKKALNLDFGEDSDDDDDDD